MMLTMDCSEFEKTVSQDSEALFFMMLTIEWSGFYIGCKSESRKPFLHDADDRIVWFLNRM